MNLRCLHCLIVFSLAFQSFGSAVEWGDFTLSDGWLYDHQAHQSLTAEFSDKMSYPCVAFQYSAKWSCLDVNVADPSIPGLMAADWVLAVFANAGDVLTWDYFKNATAAIDNHAQYGPGKFATLTAPQITEAVSLDYGKTAYLALVFWTDDQPGYTWCSFDVTYDGLSMLSNATTFSEGLIVGTGNFATSPEPSSGLLLLIGSSLLIIRRRGASLFSL